LDWTTNPMKNKPKKTSLTTAAAYKTLWQEVQAKFQK
jgi:hypothetical protein